MATTRTPTVATAPVAGTTAGRYVFAAPVKAITVFNDGVAAVCYVRTDGGTATAASGGFEFAVSNNQSVSVLAADLGHEAIDRVSIWVATGGDVSKLKVSGVG